MIELRSHFSLLRYEWKASKDQISLILESAMYFMRSFAIDLEFIQKPIERRTVAAANVKEEVRKPKYRTGVGMSASCVI